MKRRTPAFVIVISLCTLGLYFIYWLYATRAELVTEHRAKIPAMNVLLYPLGAVALVLLATLVVSLALPSDSPVLRSLELRVFPVLIVILTIAVFPLAVWWFWQYCGAVGRFTHGRLSQGEAFALFCLLAIVGAGCVWPGVVQGYFNTESLRRAELGQLEHS
jgi:hypothetical protein